MIIKQFIQTPFQQNTRIVACKATGKAICIDPGEESTEVADFIRSSGFDLLSICLTHGHLDHVGGTRFMHENFRWPKF